MNATLAVTDEHMGRAYAQLRKPDWPTLAELQEAYVHYGLVRARALGLARGQTLPPEPPVPLSPAPAAKPAAPKPTRRHYDAPTPPADSFSGRMAASGEYVHHGDVE